MTSGQKIAVSLLCSVLIFASFTVVAFSGLFALIEVRFYQPAIVNDVQNQLSQISESLDQYLETSQQRFAVDFVENIFVKESFNAAQTEQAILGREDATGVLMSEVPSLMGIRIVESGGRRLHYSTFSADMLQRSDTIISYRLYADLDVLPYDLVQSPNDSEPRIIFDPENELVVYSFPFYDDIDAYRGTILFYILASDFTRELVSKNLVRITDPAILLGTIETPVFLFGLPTTGVDIVTDAINESMSITTQGMQRFLETDTDNWVLFTDTSIDGISTARLYNEQLFVFPDAVKILLLICVFVTSYLIIFLIFNFKHDDMVVIRSRMKRFQFALINEYLTNKEEVDWNAIYKDINRRKQDVGSSIKKSLGRRAKRHEKEVADMLDKSWDEIMSAIGKQSAPLRTGFSDTASAEIKQMLEQLLSSGNITVKTVVAPSENATITPPRPTPYKSLEELEELEDLEEVETLEELEDLEEVEELEELEEIEALEEAEGLEKAEVEKADGIFENVDISIYDDPDEKSKFATSEGDISEDIFVEEMRIGESHLDKPLIDKNSENATDFNPFQFEIAKPNFSVLDNEDDGQNDIDFEPEIPIQSEETVPVSDTILSEELDANSDASGLEALKTIPHSLTLNSGIPGPVVDLELASADSIMEEGGLYVIPKDLEIDDQDLDAGFKTLVDSVLK